MNDGHWCEFCQTYHTSCSCYHPANKTHSLSPNQMNITYEVFATEEEVARLTEAFRLACVACHRVGAVEYRTHPDKGTYHSPEEWMTFFIETAKGRDPKIIEVAFAVDPSYPTFDEYE